MSPSSGWAAQACRAPTPIINELQDLAVGDVVRLAPVGGPEGLELTVDRIEVPGLLVLRTGRSAPDRADTPADDGPCATARR